MITRSTLASQIRDYLQHRITRSALVDWAEQAMREEEFDERDLGAIRDITSRRGVADVREFALTWEDCEGFLSRLGYRTKVDVVQALLSSARRPPQVRGHGGGDRLTHRRSE